MCGRATALVIGLALPAVAILSACQSVVESGDRPALDPLGSPTSIVNSTVPPATTAAEPPATSTFTTTTTTSTVPVITTTLPPATTMPTTTIPTSTVPTSTVTSTPPTTATTAALGGSTTTTAPAATTNNTATPATPYRDEPARGVLREGDRGDRTRDVQSKLIALGYLPAGSADGLFGPLTTAAVEEFQEDEDLEVDGLVGPATQAALAATGET